MRYDCQIDIDLPRDRVVMLFDDQANLRRWQTTLRAVEPLGGVPGQVGTQTRLRYRDGQRETEMVETITQRALPDRIVGTYQMTGTWCQVDNRFEAIAADVTRWNSSVEWKFDSVLHRVLGAVVPGMYKKQTEKLMTQFKQFAESQTDEGMERTQFEPQ